MYFSKKLFPLFGIFIQIHTSYQKFMKTFWQKHWQTQLTKNKFNTEPAVKPWQLNAHLRMFLKEAMLGGRELQLHTKPKGTCLTKSMKLYLTILNHLGFQLSHMEVSCGGFSCPECHQNVFPPGGRPVKIEWQSERRRESNKNKLVLLRYKTDKRNKKMGNSKDFCFCLFVWDLGGKWKQNKHFSLNKGSSDVRYVSIYFFVDYRCK